jgi:hypothetical protein
MLDLGDSDVTAALAREPDLAGHGHPPQAGCCQPPGASRPNPAALSPADSPSGDHP